MVLDCPDRESAVAELSPPIYGFKPDYMTFSREPRGRSDCGERPWVYPPCLPRAEPDGLPLGLLPVGRCASDVGLLARARDSNGLGRVSIIRVQIGS